MLSLLFSEIPSKRYQCFSFSSIITWVKGQPGSPSPKELLGILWRTFDIFLIHNSNQMKRKMFSCWYEQNLFLLINSPHGPMKIFSRSGDGLVWYGVWQEASWNNWKIAPNIPLETTDRTWVLNDTTLKAPKDHKCGITVPPTNGGTICFWFPQKIQSFLLGRTG